LFDLWLTQSQPGALGKNCYLLAARLDWIHGQETGGSAVELFRRGNFTSAEKLVD
jgi:hypothetical protein